MKKNYFFVGLLALGMMALQGCDEKNGGADDGSEGFGSGGKMEELTASAQKKRLQDVGIEVVNSIKAADHKNLVDVAVFMAEEFEYFEVDETYCEKLESLVEEEYSYADPTRAMARLMSLSLDAAQRGAQLSSDVAEVWTLSLKAGLTDVYGGFTPDEDKEIWVYDPSVNDRVELSFTDDKNQTWVATLKGGKETTRVKVTYNYDSNYSEIFEEGPQAGSSNQSSYEDHYEYVIDVPKQITFTVKSNGSSVIDLTINSSLAFDAVYNEEHEHTEFYYWNQWSEYDDGWYNSAWERSECEHAYSFDVDYTNLNVDAKLKVNAYEETFKTDVTKQGVTASAGINISGKQIFKAESTLKVDADKALGEFEDALNEEDAANVKAGVIEDFSVLIDLMGKVQVLGKCNKFAELYDAIIGIDNATDFKAYERYVNNANSAYSITLHYDNTVTEQAHVEFEAYEGRYEWSDYTYFDVRPVLVFAEDDSRYSIEEYFTESSFSDLLEAVENLAAEFEELYGGYFEDEEDDYYPY